MTEAGAGAPPPGAVDLLDDGRGPARARRPARRPPWPGLGGNARFVLAGIAVAVLVAATAVVSGRQIPAPPDRPVTGPPAPQVQLLLDQYSYSVEPGGFTLSLSLISYGTTVIDILAAHLLQPGARPVAGPGGDLPFTSPVVLAPDVSADLSVPVRVTCPGVLTAPLADHIDLTLGRGGRPVEVVHVALTPLGSLVDDARHAACGVASASASVYPTYVAGTVSAGTGAVITATLRVRDVGDAPASVAVVGGDPTSVAVNAAGPAPTVEPGRSADLKLTWSILDCAAAQAVRWPTVRLTITVPTSTATNSYGLDQTFGTAWRQALRAICAAGTPLRG